MCVYFVFLFFGVFIYIFFPFTLPDCNQFPREHAVNTRTERESERAHVRLQVSTACLIDEACTGLRTPDGWEEREQKKRELWSPSGENSITCIKYEVGRKNGNGNEKEKKR